MCWFWSWGLCVSQTSPHSFSCFFFFFFFFGGGGGGLEKPSRRVDSDKSVHHFISLYMICTLADVLLDCKCSRTMRTQAPWVSRLREDIFFCVRIGNTVTSHTLVDQMMS